SAQRLVGSSDGKQRLAGLELLRQLCVLKRSVDACGKQADAFRAKRAKPSKEELRQFEAIQQTKSESVVLTLDNALGLMDPTLRTPVVPPKPIGAQLITRAAVEALKDLDELVHQHRETAIEVGA